MDRILRLKAERIEELEKAVDEWRTKADSELAINARLHTETAKLKELEGATRIICHVESCSCRTAGMCKATTIHLQPCSPDADNVVGCSEFTEKP